MLQQQQWKELATPCAFFITSGLIDIDREIFSIIHENGLVYNGRLIVKSNFQTTENEIFACGRICEFSQRYKNLSVGRSLRLDRYNGRELGSILGKQVLEVVGLGYLTTDKYTD
jgi:predicted GNAT family N-acyltransferase